MPTRFEALPEIENSIDQNIIELPPRHQLPELVRLEDPARDIMIDFNQIPATTINESSNLDAAIELIRETNRYLLLVTNNKNQLTGIISAAYVLSSKPIQFISENRLPRNKVAVKMLMTPISEVLQLDAKLLKHARIGNIVQTMFKAQKNYALILNNKEQNKYSIQGVFALPVISKHMQKNIVIKPWVKEMCSVATMQHEDIG